MRIPDRVTLVEVGPRDGLQNESRAVPTAVRVELIERLADAGLREIEAGSFVSPKWVPQMADTGEVMARVRRRPGVRYTVLTPNRKGLDAALAARVDEVAVFVAATETFSRKNINCAIDESLDRAGEVVVAAREAGVGVRGYISCVLGCPYEGDVEPRAVARIAGRLAELGCREVSLGDTIGTGTPAKTRALFAAVAADIGAGRVAGHFHDTYGQALVNILAAMDAGVAVFDASVAGLGGCPYAKGATGNVATEDVVYMLDGMGIASGVDLDALVDTAKFISGSLERSPASRVARAMLARRAA